MNLLRKLLPGMLMSLLTTASFAQSKTTLPEVFAAYPNTVSVSVPAIDNSFANKADDQVSLMLSPEFTFTGTVLSNRNVYDNLQTILVRSAENAESVLQLSKIINADKSVSFSGRILNKSAADGYELKNEGGTYFLKKIEMNKIFQPCNL